jgi:hypothetical protein
LVLVLVLELMLVLVLVLELMLELVLVLEFESGPCISASRSWSTVWPIPLQSGPSEKYPWAPCPSITGDGEGAGPGLIRQMLR